MNDLFKMYMNGDVHVQEVYPMDLGVLVVVDIIWHSFGF